jgi:hypothetical protein
VWLEHLLSGEIVILETGIADGAFIDSSTFFYDISGQMRDPETEVEGSAETGHQQSPVAQLVRALH